MIAYMIENGSVTDYWLAEHSYTNYSFTLKYKKITLVVFPLDCIFQMYVYLEAFQMLTCLFIY